MAAPMKLTKGQTYFAILAVLLSVCLLYQSAWIFSRTTTATVYAADGTRRSGRGSRVSLMYATYTVGNHTYNGSYLRNEHDVDNRYFEIRYLLFAPDISRTNTFASNWGPLIMLFIVLSLIASIVFIRKDIISDQAMFAIQARWPLVRIENNRVDSYDQHDIDNSIPNAAEQAFRNRLRTEQDLFHQSEVSASVYKFNPNAIGIFVAYVFLFFFSFYLLYIGALKYPGVLTLGSILVFIPLYIQNTNNPTFKAKIPDQGSLVFSSHGVQFKDEFYPIENIEAAVIYLESFRGFAYSEHITTGKAKEKSSGDNNKISFRYQGQVIDFTFILDQFSDYWSFKNLMTDWAGRGVNVLMEKVFEDDFVIQEVVRFGEPVSVLNSES
jgi:hypothetical protein